MSVNALKLLWLPSECAIWNSHIKLGAIITIPMIGYSRTSPLNKFIMVCQLVTCINWKKMVSACALIRHNCDLFANDVTGNVLLEHWHILLHT